MHSFISVFIRSFGTADARCNGNNYLSHSHPYAPPLFQVICHRLGEMDLLIHRLLDLQAAVDVPEFPSGGGDTIESILSPLSLLMGQLTQVKISMHNES